MKAAPYLKPFNLDYSLKNIPIGNKYVYKQKMYHKVYKFVQNLRWKAFWYLNRYNHSDNLVNIDNPDSFEITNSSDNFFTSTNFNYSCFPSKHSAPECEHLKHFEHDLYLLIKSIEFRKGSSPFQKKMAKDIKKINSSKDLIVSSDKTNNLYFISKNEYDHLLQKNLTKNYKKAPDKYLDTINSNAQSIINDIKLKGKIKKLNNKEAF